jgi:beta-aspartyl-peptidase (threonine type)
MQSKLIDRVRWVLCLVCWSGCFPGCLSFVSAQELTGLDAETATLERKAINRVLERQTEAWNQGNLEQFMKTYWKSKSLTFSSGGTTARGWEETLRNYQNGYAPPKEMGTLKFDGLEITLLESKTALVLGNWQLTFADKTKRSGNFSLVLHKFDDRWRIIHDHSSELIQKLPEVTPPSKQDNSQ